MPMPRMRGLGRGDTSPFCTQSISHTLFTFTDVFNDFAVEFEVQGQGFTALYQNLLETQVMTINLKVRF